MGLVTTQNSMSPGLWFSVTCRQGRRPGRAEGGFLKVFLIISFLIVFILLSPGQGVSSPLWVGWAGGFRGLKFCLPGVSKPGWPSPITL